MIRIPQRIFPLMFFTTKIPVTIIPMIARSTVIPTSLNDADTPSTSLYLSTENY